MFTLVDANERDSHYLARAFLLPPSWLIDLPVSADSLEVRTGTSEQVGQSLD